MQLLARRSSGPGLVPLVLLLGYAVTLVSGCNSWCTCVKSDGSHLCTGRADSDGNCPACLDLNVGHNCCQVGCPQRHQCSEELPTTESQCCPSQLKACNDGDMEGCLIVNGGPTCVKVDDFHCKRTKCPNGNQSPWAMQYVHKTLALA